MKTIGWLEINLKIPDDWELTAESGGLNDAYMRFDSVDKVRLEVKWERTRRSGEVLPHIALENFLKKIAEQSKKKRAIKVLERGSAKVAGHKAIYSIWSIQNERFITMSWLCPDESKIILLQYGLETEETKEGVFQEILKTITCHAMNGFYPYELLGVSFLVPKGFSLTRRKLLVGRVQMIFQKGDSKLFISWSGLAKEQLKKYESLGDFFLSTLASDVKGLDKGLNDLIKAVKKSDSEISQQSQTKSKLSFLSKERSNSLKVYLDEDSNRIFALAYSIRAEDEELARAFIESVKAKA